MFNLGISELLLLGALALIFIGPKELPELARVLARFLNDLKRASDDVKDYVSRETSILDARRSLRKDMENLEASDKELATRDRSEENPIAEEKPKNPEKPS